MTLEVTKRNENCHQVRFHTHRSVFLRDGKHDTFFPPSSQLALVLFSSSLFFLCVSLSPSDSADLSVTVETCRQVVNELSNSLRKTLQVYSKVSFLDGRVAKMEE